MAYRNGTYVAFDGLGQSNPVLSDYRYYSTLRAWHGLESKEFRFANSHERTAATKDGVSVEHLRKVIRQRLAVSKRMLVILSRHTRKTGSFLSYELLHGVNSDGLPLICCYPGTDVMLDPEDYRSRWPTVLEDMIDRSTVRAMHVPFKIAAIKAALDTYSIHDEIPGGALFCYNERGHRQLGLI